MSREIQTTIDINAPIERVWAQFTAFDRYPAWSRFITSVEGKLEIGARLRVVLHPASGKKMVFRPKVTQLRAGQELRWVGTLGHASMFRGEHYYRFQDMGEGRTRLHHGEVFSGFLLGLLWRLLGTSSQLGFVAFNEALKGRSEAASKE